MTKPRFTEKNDLYFNDWLRENLPDSQTFGTTINDIDFIIYNYKTKKLMLIERKCRMRDVNYSQKNIFTIINKALFHYSKVSDEYIYCGFNLISFENDTFENGKVFLNNKEISKEDLIKFLSI